MDEEINRGTIQSHESSFTRPRFLGVPRDDQLLEASSSEGILGGRTISEVYTQDTEALAAAGYNWQRAVHVLQCLAVASDYSAAAANYRGIVEPVGFPGLRAQNTEENSYYENPITHAGIQGEPKTPIEAKAESIHDYEVSNGNLNFVINPLTIYLAEAHHLLEKGNRYALTGEQLVQLIQSFDQEAINGDDQLNAWIEKENRERYGPYKTLPRHSEKITFLDDSEIGIQVGNYGSLSLLTNNKNLALVQFGIEKETESLNRVAVISDRFNITCTRKGNEWEMGYAVEKSPGSFNHNYIDEQIPENSPLWQFIDMGYRFVDRAKRQPDEILTDDDATIIHNFINKRADLPDTAFTEPEPPKSIF